MITTEQTEACLLEVHRSVITDRGAAWDALRAGGRVLPVDGSDWELPLAHAYGETYPAPAMFFTRREDVAAALIDPNLTAPLSLGVINGYQVLPDLAWMTDEGRRVLTTAIDPRWSRRTAALFTRVVTGLFDRIAERGRCEAMAEVCSPLLDYLWYSMFYLPTDAYPPPSLRDLVAVRRAQPGTTDLITRIITVAPQITDDEVFALAVFCYHAARSVGHIFGFALLELARRPDLARRLRENPHEIPVFVEEVMRTEVPAPWVWRVASAPTRVGDVDLPQGTCIALALGAANCEGDGGNNVNDSTRKHFGLGAGQSRCRGNHLVRAALRGALNEWLTRVPTFTLAPNQDPLRVWGREAEPTNNVSLAVSLRELKLQW
ncbi:hypothetical protein [Mycobacterium sp. 23]|uniref:hypothetical protein n=1 Tax=Mycobacterium sp. 23 TaxID=3400424 RepID=UPI003AAB8223